MAARLTFEEVERRYGGFQALKGFSLDIAPGEVVCLLGPSGSGKTTLLRIASGIEKPTGGRVLISNFEVAGPNRFVPPEQRNVGLMFQDFALFPHLSIRDNVAFGLKSLGGRRRRARRSRRSTAWDSRATPTPTRTSSRAASSSGSRWRGRCCRGPP